MKWFLYIVCFFILMGCQEQEPSFYADLKEINELTLAEVRVEKTFIIDDPDIRFKEIGSRSGVLIDMVDWVKRKTAVGKRIGIYSFGTYFSAYIALNKLSEEDVVIDRKKKQCTLTLPPVEIKEWGRDFEVKEEHERVTLYRDRLTPQEKARAKNEASSILREEMAKNTQFRQELIRNAEDKAHIYFTTLLSNWGYQSNIRFREE